MTGIHDKYKKATVNIILMILISVVCLWVVPKIILLFMPFVLGGFLSLLLNPFVCFWEEKIKIKRKIGTLFIMLLVLLFISAFLFGIGYRLSRKAIQVWDIIPGLWHQWEGKLVIIIKQWSPMLEEIFSELPVDMVKTVEEIGDTIGNRIRILFGDYSVKAALGLKTIADHIPRIVIAVIMCLLSAYFFVVEKEKVKDFLWENLPEAWKKKCKILKQTTGKVTVGYFKAQFKIEIWVYFILVVGFLLMKVRYGYLLAIPIAVLDFLPVFGTGIVLLPWAVFKLLAGDYGYALGLFFIWALGQLVRQLIQPKMMEESMGLSSIPTLILLYLGYQFAGVIGMMAAVPLGNLVVAMNKVGFFENGKQSIGILWNAVLQFRQFSEEEK